MKKTIKLYCSKTHKPQIVETLIPDMLSLYACGPTVYSFAHIGNFRSFLTADLLVRTAKAIGMNVQYVSNITDVGHLSEDDVADALGEDKMVKALRHSEGKFANIWDLARFYTDNLLDDWKQLNLLQPDVRPRASEHVTEQLCLIDQLLKKGYAYETSQGVYFDVKKFPKYGDLSGNSLASLRNEVRDLVKDPDKRNPQDFALWKKDDNHLMRWFSPYGWGYPGWHIECSAMAMKYLGVNFDIHTGGIDNKFPHHECEIAQSEAVTQQNFVNYWVHTAHLLVNGKRMSKRDGTFYTVKQILDENVHPFALRHALTCAVYREPLNFNMQSLDVSKKFYNRITSTYQKIVERNSDKNGSICTVPAELQENYLHILDAMLDDLNTPMAYSHLLAGIKLIHHKVDQFTHDELTGCMGWFKECDLLLGLMGIEETLAKPRNTSADKIITTFIEYRDDARKNGDYAQADKIRDKLQEIGVGIKDLGDKTEWYII